MLVKTFYITTCTFKIHKSFTVITTNPVFLVAHEGLYQGTYQSYVEAIGDKKAGKTTMPLAYNFTE